VVSFQVCRCRVKVSCHVIKSLQQVFLMFAVFCSVVQCVAVCCSVLQCVAVRCSALQCVAVCCSVLQCVAVCCSVLQCVIKSLQQVFLMCVVFSTVGFKECLSIVYRAILLTCIVYQIILLTLLSIELLILLSIDITLYRVILLTFTVDQVILLTFIVYRVILLTFVQLYSLLHKRPVSQKIVYQLSIDAEYRLFYRALLQKGSFAKGLFCKRDL